jgi:DHA2 family multidrug resistance protein
MFRIPHRHLRSVSAHSVPSRFLAVNLAIGLEHFLVLFNGGAYLPMIPRIIGALGRNALYGSWTQDLYFLALGLGLPLGRWASQRFGNRNSLLFCLAAIFFASLVNATTREYVPFLTARIVAGLAGGLSIPLSLNLLLRHYHSDRRDHGLFLWGIAAITPFAIGPFIGGWIDDAWGWRWLFLLNLPILLMSFLGIWLWEPPERQEERPSMDWLGYALLVASLVTLQMLCNLGSKDDWWRSPEIRLLAVLTLVLGGGDRLVAATTDPASVGFAQFSLCQFSRCGPRRFSHRSGISGYAGVTHRSVSAQFWLQCSRHWRNSSQSGHFCTRKRYLLALVFGPPRSSPTGANFLAFAQWGCVVAFQL